MQIYLPTTNYNIYGTTVIRCSHIAYNHAWKETYNRVYKESYVVQ